MSVCMYIYCLYKYVCYDHIKWLNANNMLNISATLSLKQELGEQII